MVESDLYFAASAACLDNADSLIAAAVAVLDSGQPNIAFHLAVLALEEIGKHHFLTLNRMADLSDGSIEPFSDKQHTDHQKKLFWCFFGGMLTAQSVDPAAIRDAEKLAETLHSKRVAGLYVDVTAKAVSVPSDNVSADDAQGLLDLARARQALARSQTLREHFEDSEAELLTWFLRASGRAETRAFIFSKSSLAKLIELDDVPIWTAWLKSELDERKRSEHEAIALELARVLPKKGEKPKWRIRFRLYSVTHSIRPGPLKTWNSAMQAIQLSPVAKKPELIVDLTLHDNVPVAAVYDFGWALARHFTVALNLATLGTWWWRFAEDTTKWYERIDDLQNPAMQVVLEKGEEPLDWGKDRKALNEDDMARLMAVLTALPMPAFGPRPAMFFDYYAAGLEALASSSVHMPRAGDALIHFAAAMRMLMGQRGDLKPNDPLEPAFTKFVAARMGSFDEQPDMTEILRALDAAQNGGAPVNGPMPKMTFAGLMKAFVDWYYMVAIHPISYKDVKDKFARPDA
ncbi:MAG: AbiV family abortive infection protein [Candidatus Devosia phytovorans]|uniref:AbiV family abortive infection protein n=1 Tax=Candidatus Devosia phytovorans TaxID=3121372 RepID=A0AAJ6B1C1_9HYPH|nr:AbiV family abortive infection protein [Devosia sp.]WEK06635.1 MAG: AbiV family abortive infection protein [Devosia sp.]